MVFEIRNNNEVILFRTYLYVLVDFGLPYLTQALLLLFNVFTMSDCVTNYKIVEHGS